MLIKRFIKGLGFSIGLFIFLIVLNTIIFRFSSLYLHLKLICEVAVLALVLLTMLSKTKLKMQKASNFSIFKEGFTDFSHLVIGIVNFVLLLMVYLLGVGPVSIIAKLFKQHFLDIKPTHLISPAVSYWKDHKITKQNLENYLRSF